MYSEKNNVNNRYLILISLIAGMGGYLFGYDRVVISHRRREGVLRSLLFNSRHLQI
jgi:hypothetical protein